MSLRQLAVQNKLDTSRMAIGWLKEVKSELSILIWYLEHYQKLGDGMLAEFAKRAAKLASFEREAPNYINAIELYYNLNETSKRYNVELLLLRYFKFFMKLSAII